GLAVDIACLIGGEEQGNPRDLLGVSGAAQRIEPAELVLFADLSGIFERTRGHTRLDQSGADRIDPHIGSRELLRCGLYEIDHPCLARRINWPARAGAQPSDAARAKDRPAALL